MPRKEPIVAVLQMHADNLRLTSVLRVLCRGCDLAGAFAELIRGKSPEPFASSLRLLEETSALPNRVEALHRTAIRAAVTEAYEAVKAYCKETEQFERFRSQPWFHVVRIIRNGLNHDSRLQFNEADKRLMPLEWNAIHLELNDENKEIDEHVLSVEKAIAWLQTIDDFLESELE